MKAPEIRIQAHQPLSPTPTHPTTTASSSGRFGYSKSYVDGVVAKLQPPFTAPLARDFSPHLDAGEPVPGFLYIIQKEG